MTYQIEAVNLCKDYQEGGVVTSVLKGVNISVRAGETLGILGASGAGKSTLLHLLGTLDTPSRGQLLFEGQDLLKQKARYLNDFRNQKLGFVFQFHHLLSDFTALENVMMPLLIRGWSQKKAAKLALEILERVGLDSRTSHRPQELSGGEQQRVAIARALVGRPPLILADEPTGNLDSTNGIKIFDLLLSLNRELKSTLIVVTHNEKLSTCLERTLHLMDGKIKEKS